MGVVAQPGLATRHTPEARAVADALAGALGRLVPFDTLSLASVENLCFDELAAWGGDGRRALMNGVITPEGLAVMARGDPVIIPDARKVELPVTVAMRRSGILSAVIFPIVEGDDAHGALVLGYREPDRPSPETVAIVSDFLPLVSKAVRTMVERHRHDQARHQLASVERLQQELLRLVGRELRSGLVAMTVAAQSLPAARGSEISGRAHRMMRMLDAVVEVSRLERGLFAHEPTLTTTLPGTIRAAVADVQADAPNRVIDAHIGDLGSVIVDEARISELVTQLTDNAVRYSPPGTPVEVRAGRRELDIEISVLDEGPGIPEADRARVFERFTRLAGTGAEGIGLGLYLARAIAERHGGTITLQAGRNGTGSTFVVTLPQPATTSANGASAGTTP